MISLKDAGWYIYILTLPEAISNQHQGWNPRYRKETHVSEMKVNDPGANCPPLRTLRADVFTDPNGWFVWNMYITFPKTNIAPARRPSHKKNHFPKPNFSDAMLVSWKVHMHVYSTSFVDSMGKPTPSFCGDAHELLCSRQLLAPRLGYSRFRQRCSACYKIGKGWLGVGLHTVCSWIGWGLVVLVLFGLSLVGFGHWN